ncbi:MAG: rhodanese-like domain-containing protein [Hamadaea sp.]|nr:rhodanese-like domain-containing protein [Hamadaea sp.]NUR46702.1 rhodanese-like domain-containing protein [Hamadaea sp.]NUT03565.1 rhodanese-like domain-containing protein [Hamadaea sp.]
MSFTTWLSGLFAKPYRTIGAAEAQELQRGGAILLDVREKHEWQAGHAPKARHIPLGQLSARSAELPAGRAVVTVCQSGMRSAQAARFLATQGREVANLSGGMNAWSRAGLPVTR